MIKNAKLLQELSNLGDHTKSFHPSKTATKEENAAALKKFFEEVDESVKEKLNDVLKRHGVTHASRVIKSRDAIN